MDVLAAKDWFLEGKTYYCKGEGVGRRKPHRFYPGAFEKLGTIMIQHSQHFRLRAANVVCLAPIS